MSRSWGVGTSTAARSGALLLALSWLVACNEGAGAPAPADGAGRSTPAGSGQSPEEGASLPPHTDELDSVAALGHSNLTGTMSDPDEPFRDARENSWATGSNPRVASIYRRLLEDHPALAGHNYNGAVNGATIDSMVAQYESLLYEAEVAPDLFLIQFIDNDIQCDGEDAQHAKEFGRELNAGLTRIAADLPDAQFYLTGPWASVELWSTWAARHDEHVEASSGTGPCDVFDARGRPRPDGVRSMQGIVDAYVSETEEVCAQHPGCFTDERAMERFVPVDRDVAEDLNHLSVAGHAKYVRIAWSALPDEIKQVD